MAIRIFFSSVFLFTFFYIYNLMQMYIKNGGKKNESIKH